MLALKAWLSLAVGSPGRRGCGRLAAWSRQGERHEAGGGRARAARAELVSALRARGIPAEDHAGAARSAGRPDAYARGLGAIRRRPARVRSLRGPARAQSGLDRETVARPGLASGQRTLGVAGRLELGEACGWPEPRESRHRGGCPACSAAGRPRNPMCGGAAGPTSETRGLREAGASTNRADAFILHEDHGAPDRAFCDASLLSAATLRPASASPARRRAAGSGP